MPPNKHSNPNVTQAVTAYSTFLVNVLAILTYGEWDVITMLQSDFSKLHGTRLARVSHYTSLASQAAEDILERDPELTFMPYLLGIYILQAGYAVLAVAERINDPAYSASCKSLETFIRAHESCIATLDTKYQVGLT
ncbi:Xylanolytic transcriptional activator xlnR [Penicillium rolfsii]|nr:Xylanolytic transcriptional activator xlnR [Penicillium rolfsii]